MANVANIIRFENLNSDLRGVLGIKGEIPRFKKGIRRLPNHFSQYYKGAPELINEVARCFPNTLKRFKYNFVFSS